jgi:hypothetical protein
VPPEKTKYKLDLGLWAGTTGASIRRNVLCWAPLATEAGVRPDQGLLSTAANPWDPALGTLVSALGEAGLSEGPEPGARLPGVCSPLVADTRLPAGSGSPRVATWTPAAPGLVAKPVPGCAVGRTRAIPCFHPGCGLPSRTAMQMHAKQPSFLGSGGAGRLLAETCNPGRLLYTGPRARG